MTHFPYIESKMNNNHPKLDECGHPFLEECYLAYDPSKIGRTGHPFLEGYFSV